MEHDSSPPVAGTARLDYRSVVVPLDLGYDADRALPVGAAVAAKLGVELVTVTVTSPKVHRVDDEIEARAHGRWAGIVLDQTIIRCGDDIASEILAEEAERHGLPGEPSGRAVAGQCGEARAVLDAGASPLPLGRTWPLRSWWPAPRTRAGRAHAPCRHPTGSG